MRFQKPKGTRDVMGVELKRINAVEHRARAFFEKNGFQEMRTPTFESAELFIRSIGEHTDIVEKENYTFKSNKKVFMLRPEGTASVLRAIIENKLPTPCRYFYIEPMFRKERPQKGRYREFLQVGLELIGEADPFFDAEIIALASKFIEKLKPSDYVIELNSIGCPQCRIAYKERLARYLVPKKNELCVDCQRRLDKNFLRIFDCKNPGCQELYKTVPKITDNLCKDCREHYNKVKELLEVFSINYLENKKMVRGLDYYTRTVFEFKDNTGTLGAQNTFLAGGRYDLLMKELGGTDSPALGWAMGIDRLLRIIDANEVTQEPPLRFFIATIGKEHLNQTLHLRESIIAAGSFCIIMGNPEKTLKHQLKKANRLNVDYTIIFGEDEAKRSNCIIKNMHSGEQKQIGLDKVVSFIKELYKNNIQVI